MSAESSPERATPRQLLAAIALAELPMPESVLIHANGNLTLGFQRLSDGIMWSTHLGVAAGMSTHDGSRWLRTARIPRWHGWLVHLHASEDLPDPEEPLDADTTAQLQAVADGDPAGGAS